MLRPGERTWIDAGASFALNTRGSAIVDGGEELSVVASYRNLAPGATAPAAAYSGFTNAAGDPALRVGRVINLPLVLANWGAWHTTFVIQNLGAVAATPYIVFYNSAGSVRTPPGAVPLGPLPPGGSAELDANGFQLGQFTGTAILSSISGDLAVIVKETNGAMSGNYNGSSGGAQTVQVPLVLSAWNGWVTQMQIQNVATTAPAAVTINYYNADGSQPPGTTQSLTIPGLGFANAQYPGAGNWTGVAMVSSTQPLAVEVDEYNGSLQELQSYNGVGFASPAVALPYLEASPWDTSLQVQNAGSGTAQVKITTTNGQQLWPGAGTYPIASHGSVNVRLPYADGAMVQSVHTTIGSSTYVAQPLAVELDIYRSGGVDQLMSYTGLGR